MRKMTYTSSANYGYSFADGYQHIFDVQAIKNSMGAKPYCTMYYVDSSQRELRTYTSSASTHIHFLGLALSSIFFTTSDTDSSSLTLSKTTE